MQEPDLPHIHAGDLEDSLAERFPLTGAVWHGADQRRTWTLAAIGGADKLLGAIEALARLLQVTHDWVREHPADFAEEFIVRIRSDFEDAMDGMLTHKQSSVMDPCRDLMELTVLFREFDAAPTKWLFGHAVGVRLAG